MSHYVPNLTALSRMRQEICTWLGLGILIAISVLGDITSACRNCQLISLFVCGWLVRNYSYLH